MYSAFIVSVIVSINIVDGYAVNRTNDNIEKAIADIFYSNPYYIAQDDDSDKTSEEAQNTHTFEINGQVLSRAFDPESPMTHVGEVIRTENKNENDSSSTVEKDPHQNGTYSSKNGTGKLNLDDRFFSRKMFKLLYGQDSSTEANPGKRSATDPNTPLSNDIGSGIKFLSASFQSENTNNFPDHFTEGSSYLPTTIKDTYTPPTKNVLNTERTLISPSDRKSAIETITLHKDPSKVTPTNHNSKMGSDYLLIFLCLSVIMTANVCRIN